MKKTTAFLTDPNAIREWLATYCEITGDISISPEGRVSVVGDVWPSSILWMTLTHFAVQFDHITGDFNFENCVALVSLRGTPTCVDGNVSFSGCTALKTLEGAPRQVGGNFDCSCSTGLLTLVGAPLQVGGSFNCHLCYRLHSLTGAPKTVGADFNCSECHRLTSLEGAPSHVNGYFDCSGGSKLVTLQGSPCYVGDTFYCNYCDDLSSLAGAPSSVGKLRFEDCPKLLTLDGLPAIRESLEFERFEKPDPVIVIKLLQHRVQLITKQKAKWITIVNDYHKSGDLLTAIAQFEKQYKVSFKATTADKPLLQTELPSL